MRSATLGLVALVVAADMLWSPGLVDRAPAIAEVRPDPTVSNSLTQALELYTAGVEPVRWESRRRAAAYLLKQPLSQRAGWELVSAALEKAAHPASAWECWQQFSQTPPAHGLFGAYQNRLSGLRRAQLQARAENLRSVLEKNDYAAYLGQMPLTGDSRGPLGLALTLQPFSQVGRDDLISYDLWWPILVNLSQEQALRAGVRLARNQTPEMPHRWEGRTCVCWSAGPDGKDDGGTLEADWVYRFR